MDNTKELTTLSLCTGYGGLELGLRLAGVKSRAIAYVEIEAFAVANLVAKIEENQLDVAPIWTNLKTFNARPFRERVDILTGGYPCQPFSETGQRKGIEDPRHLFPSIARIIEECRPKLCFFENVAGHLSLGFGEVVRCLHELGYGVTAGMYSAAEVGASHYRKRIFILGYSEHFRQLTTANSTSESEGTGSSAVLEYSDSERLQRRWRYGLGTEKEFEHNRRSQAFPNFRGSPAHNWENARLKPRLGRADDGYPLKVDRLRLLGNGVVPLQAALAFRSLLKKI